MIPRSAKKQTTKRQFSLKTTLLVILLVPVALIFIFVVSALVSTTNNTAKFVNEDLKLQNKLNIPPLLQSETSDGQKIFNLTAQTGKTSFLPNQQTETFGYNGSYFGPTIRASKGDNIRINVTNELAEPTTAHWHGMHLPAAMDGGPQQTIKPAGNVWRPNWTVTNQASTLWYHPHMMGKTGEQVYRGLAGFFLIDDDNADSLSLPKDYGVDDIPLAVQDRKFDDNGQLVYTAMSMDLLGHTGMLGDKILVNGTYAPYLDVPAKQIRLRVLNASNARRFDFAFEDNRKFQQIASDGGLLESPVSRTNMILSPGERAEIVVDLSSDTKPLTLMSRAIYEDDSVIRFIRELAKADRDEKQQFKILEIRPQSTTLTSSPLPAKLNTVGKIEPATAIKTRKFMLDSPTSINGKSMDHNVVNEIVRSGDTEIWEVRNESGTYHPFHIHGVQFQVIDRRNSSNVTTAPAEYEKGWKDTVLIPNSETVRLIMRFPEFSDPRVPYMYHCHILEHEDMGMMGQFVVVSKDTKESAISLPKNDALDHSAHDH